MKFNPDADLGTSGVEDVRGSGGGGSLIPGGMGSGDLTACDTWTPSTL